VVGIFDDGFFIVFFRGFGFFRIAERHQFGDGIHLEGGDAFAFRLVALHTDEFFYIDVEGFAESVASSEGHSDAWIDHVGEQDELTLLVLAQKVQFLVGRLEGKSFEVRITLLVGIVEGGAPYLVRVELLNQADTCFVVVVQVEVGGIEISVLHDDEDEVFAMEFTQVLSAFIVVQAEHIRVEPYFSSAQGRTSPLLEDNLVYVVLREDVPHRLASLDADFAEILFEGNLLDFRIRLVRYLDDFGFTVRIDGEVDDA